MRLRKPGAQTWQAMAVDRELLVVASTFSDQQQRTIRFVQSEIANSSGRLEPTVAIVIHMDQSGNTKLRNWGRDLAISILPIDGTIDFGEARDIERHLSAQLFSHDPFDVTGPVSGDNQFFGRRDEAIDLARKLQRGQIRSCLGIRKIGKTSIINRVLKEIPAEFDCKTIMVDCSKDDVFELSAEKLLYSIGQTLRKLNETGVNYHSVIATKSEITLADARIEFEQIVLSIKDVFLLVFDEVDYITPGSPTAKHWKADFNKFWRNLRSVYQECDRLGKPFSLLIGGVSTYWFTVDQIDGVENAALAFVPEEFLSPMATGATVAMLRRLGKVAGINFSDDAATWISEETGNMPYWARKCCSYIHRQTPISNRPLDLSRSDVLPMVEAFIENEGSPIAEVALNHLFRVHPEMKRVSERLLRGENDSVSDATKRTLRKYGVINIRDKFAGGMIEKAVRSIVQSVDRTQATSEINGAVPADSLKEWAEDLAALGQRRNIIERKMRGIVLNFLRMAAMQAKKLDKLGVQVSNELPEARRKQLVDQI